MWLGQTDQVVRQRCRRRNPTHSAGPRQPCGLSCWLWPPLWEACCWAPAPGECAQCWPICGPPCQALSPLPGPDPDAPTYTRVGWPIALTGAIQSRRRRSRAREAKAPSPLEPRSPLRLLRSVSLAGFKTAMYVESSHCALRHVQAPLCLRCTMWQTWNPPSTPSLDWRTSPCKAGRPMG